MNNLEGNNNQNPKKNNPPVASAEKNRHDEEPKSEGSTTMLSLSRVDLYVMRFINASNRNMFEVVDEVWLKENSLTSEEKREITRRIAVYDWDWTVTDSDVWLYQATKYAVDMMVDNVLDRNVLDEFLVGILEEANYAARLAILNYPGISHREYAIAPLERLMATKDLHTMGGCQMHLMDLYEKYQPEKLPSLDFDPREIAEAYDESPIVLRLVDDEGE